jgi:hypothetical protein
MNFPFNEILWHCILVLGIYQVYRSWIKGEGREGRLAALLLLLAGLGNTVAVWEVFPAGAIVGKLSALGYFVAIALTALKRRQE